MRRSLLLSSFFLLLAFVAGPAVALPAPMSDDELLTKSDLVALIRVRHRWGTRHERPVVPDTRPPPAETPG